MKKQILLISLLSLFAIGTYGQGVRFGIKISPNLSWTKPDSPGFDGAGNIIGYSFGLLADLKVGEKDNYAFATGLLLTNTGGKYAYPYTYTATDSTLRTSEVESQLKLRYIEIPLALKLKTNEIGYLTYFGQLGMSIGFNIRAKADIETIDASGTKSTLEDVDMGDEVNLFRSALIAGVGIEYNISGDTYIMAGFTYNGGFTNTLDGVKDEQGKDVKVLQNYVELNLGVFF